MSADSSAAKEVVLASEDEVVEGEIVEEDDNPDRARMRKLLDERREASQLAGHINNSNLYAGSPMYFYCKFCGVLTETLPEGYFLSTPKKTCGDCETLIELGWHDGKTPTFPFSN